jgi:hypothetical protein
LLLLLLLCFVCKREGDEEECSQAWLEKGEEDKTSEHVKEVQRRQILYGLVAFAETCFPLSLFSLSRTPRKRYDKNRETSEKIHTVGFALISTRER